MNSVGWLLAPAIAALAAAIAWAQWWTARQRLILDLFEKRFQVFLDVRRIASEAQQLGKLTDAGFANEVLARGRFLFGDDVVDALKKLHSLTTDLEVRDPRAPQEINQHFKAMIPLFYPYLRMHQTMPKWPWHWQV